MDVDSETMASVLRRLRRAQARSAASSKMIEEARRADVVNAARPRRPGHSTAPASRSIATGLQQCAHSDDRPARPTVPARAALPVARLRDIH